MPFWPILIRHMECSKGVTAFNLSLIGTEGILIVLHLADAVLFFIFL